MNRIFDMIKKNYRIFVGLFILVVGICTILLNRGTYSVDEDTIVDGLNVTCDDSISKGEEFECSISLNSVSMVTKGIALNYNIDEIIRFVGFTSDNWEVSTSDENGFVLVNLDGVSGETSVGTINFKMPDDAVDNSTYKIELVDATIGDGEDTVVELDSVSDDVKIKSDVKTFDLKFDNTLNIDREKKYVKYLAIGTTVHQFKELVTVVGGSVSVCDENDNIMSENDVLSTGDKLKIYFDSELVDEYKLSVIGDSTGDGRVSIVDLAQFRKHYVEWVNPQTGIKFKVSGEYEQAFDFNKDGRISIVDLAIMRKTVAR